MPLVCGFFIATLTAFLFVNAGGPWQLFFYIVFVGGGIVSFVRSGDSLNTYALARLWPVWALIAYCCIVAIVLTQHTPEHAIKVARNSLTTAVFVALCVLVFAQRSEHVGKVLFAMGVLGLAGACASIVLHAFDGEARLEPLGQAQHSISGASVYGILGVVSLHLYLTREGTDRFVHLAVVVSVFALVLLTRSRGELLAYTVACVAALVLPLGRDYQVRKAWLAVVAFATTALLLIFAFIPDYLMQIVERGAGSRPQIWIYTLSKVQLAPWFGHGFTESLDFFVANDERVAHPHNIFLSTLFYSGLFGLGLLIVLVVSLLRAVWRQRGTTHGHLSACLIIHLGLSTLTDGGRLVTGASDFLFYFWLPVCMIVGCALRTGTWTAKSRTL